MMNKEASENQQSHACVRWSHRRRHASLHCPAHVPSRPCTRRTTYAAHALHLLSNSTGLSSSCRLRSSAARCTITIIIIDSAVLTSFICQLALLSDVRASLIVIIIIIVVVVVVVAAAAAAAAVVVEIVFVVILY